uniref:J domain-containing protein n=1 Tax=Corethron hystrix TaxID=216773 RepID=A0A7S1B9Q5_9STRA|mmetsp:Transcript_17315/g.39089  ORF Transcript_17315/g.39089 Transcript_17315/m.39089 type:complete len:420 (+) Transcript_17315:91-1350(+)
MSSADPPPGTEEIPEDEPEAPPYHLMPVAALLGSYAFLACLHLLRRVYVRFKCRESKASTAEAASGRAENPFSALAFQAITVAGAAILYGYIVGIVEAGLAASKVFDPFEILGVATGANTTLIKRAYRQLSLVHHPDKGGSEETFQQVALAYKALSDPIARENWQKHGHPDGPVRASFDFALPSWLLHPQGITAIVLLVLYLGMFVAIIIYAIRTVAKNDEDAVQKHQDMSVARPDQNYLQIMLEDKSTHEDVLYFIATTPENLHMAKKSLVAKEKAVREAAAKKDDKKDEKKKTDSLLDDDDDWDNDGDDDIKQHEASKIEQLKILQAVTGKDTSNEDDDKFEGLHEGVIGQQWVEKKLEAAGAWPPTLSTFSKNAMYNQMMAMAGKENAKMDEDWIKKSRREEEHSFCYGSPLFTQT